MQTRPVKELNIWYFCVLDKWKQITFFLKKGAKVFLTRWLSVAKQQVHIRAQEGAGGGHWTRGGRAWSRWQSFAAQSLKVCFVVQLCDKKKKKPAQEHRGESRDEVMRQVQKKPNT